MEERIAQEKLLFQGKDKRREEKEKEGHYQSSTA